MRKSLFRRGMVLLQTLVISVILSMIAVMVLKWVLARYMFAARNYRSSEANIHTQGCAMYLFSQWNFGTSTISSGGTGGGCPNMDRKDVGYSTTRNPASAQKTIVLTTEED